MRKIFAMLTACALLGALLTGCQKSGDSVQPALDFRTLLMDASTCTYTADVTADYGERVYRFTVDCDYLPDGGAAKITVTAPETIAGISATVDAKTAAITFDDVNLELGLMAGGHVAPLQLPQLLGAAWTGDYIVSAGADGDGWVCTYRSGYDDAQLDILTYFSAQNTPYLAEVFAGGQCVLSAQIDNFSMS